MAREPKNYTVVKRFIWTSNVQTTKKCQVFKLHVYGKGDSMS